MSFRFSRMSCLSALPVPRQWHSQSPRLRSLHPARATLLAAPTSPAPSTARRCSSPTTARSARRGLQGQGGDDLLRLHPVPDVCPTALAGRAKSCGALRPDGDKVQAIHHRRSRARYARVAGRVRRCSTSASSACTAQSDKIAEVAKATACSTARARPTWATTPSTTLRHLRVRPAGPVAVRETCRGARSDRGGHQGAAGREVTQAGRDKGREHSSSNLPVAVSACVRGRRAEVTAASIPRIFCMALASIWRMLGRHAVFRASSCSVALSLGLDQRRWTLMARLRSSRAGQRVAAAVLQMGELRLLQHFRRFACGRAGRR